MASILAIDDSPSVRPMVARTVICDGHELITVVVVSGHPELCRTVDCHHRAGERHGMNCA